MTDQISAKQDHRNAMELCDYGGIERRAGNTAAALTHYREAFELETKAAYNATGQAKTILSNSALEILKLIRDLEAIKP